MQKPTSKIMPGKPIITLTLLGTGSILALTGMTMLVAGLAKSTTLYKAWNLIGVSEAGVGTLHQISAVGFLGAAGTHIFNNRKIIGRHLRASFDAPPRQVAPEGTAE